MKQTTVGTRELKNQLSKYLRRVKAGEPITITEHGKPIGQIIPYPEDLSQRLKNLASTGLLEWTGAALPAYQPKAVNRSQKLLSDLVIEDRE